MQVLQYLHAGYDEVDMKFFLIALFVIFGFLQYKLWVAKQGVAQVVRLQEQVQKLMQQNEILEKQNAVIQARVTQYKQGLSGFEDRAREDLGLVKQGEVFYLDHIAENQNKL